MGTSGVPWNIDISLIIQALKKHKGKVTYAAADLHVDYTTLQKRIKANPDLTQLVSDLRLDLDEILQDSAESVLEMAMANAKKDMANALKASFFALNNKGKSRGYNPKHDPNFRNVDNTEQVNEQAASAFISQREACQVSQAQALVGSAVAPEQPVPHQECRGEKGAVQPKLGAASISERSAPMQDNTQG